MYLFQKQAISNCFLDIFLSVTVEVVIGFYSAITLYFAVQAFKRA
jgi:hypothetical protein